MGFFSLSPWDDNFKVYGLMSFKILADHPLWTQAVATFNGLITWIVSYPLNICCMQLGDSRGWISRTITLFWSRFTSMMIFCLPKIVCVGLKT